MTIHTTIVNTHTSIKSLKQDKWWPAGTANLAPHRTAGCCHLAHL